MMDDGDGCLLTVVVAAVVLVYYVHAGERMRCAGMRRGAAKHFMSLITSVCWFMCLRERLGKEATTAVISYPVFDN